MMNTKMAGNAAQIHAIDFISTPKKFLLIYVIAYSL